MDRQGLPFSQSYDVVFTYCTSITEQLNIFIYSFQDTYERIKSNTYKIPCWVGSAARALITSLLAANPKHRPATNMVVHPKFVIIMNLLRFGRTSSSRATCLIVYLLHVSLWLLSFLPTRLFLVSMMAECVCCLGTSWCAMQLLCASYTTWNGIIKPKSTYSNSSCLSTTATSCG